MSKKLPNREQVAQRLRESIVPYVNLDTLRSCAANNTSLRDALIDPVNTPDEISALLDLCATLFAPDQRTQIRSPADCAGMLIAEMSTLDHEQLRVVLLDTKDKVQEVVTVYKGTLNSSVVRVCELFKHAILKNSAAIILAHNHPSGDPTPSPEDVLITRKIVDAANLLDIELLDHLVIGMGRWVSMRERGLGFNK